LAVFFLCREFWQDNGKIPRQQLLDPIDGMIGDADRRLEQISFGIDGIEFRRTDKVIQDLKASNRYVIRA
jgi:hypothetical protein